MDCSTWCSRTPYHSLQDANGNYLNASDAQTINAGATVIFTLPKGCVILGVYYNTNTASQNWQFIDMAGSDAANITLAFPRSIVQSEVMKRAVGDTYFDNTLLSNDAIFKKFVSCQLVQQDDTTVTIKNNSVTNGSYKIVYVDYSWLFR